MSKLMSVAMTTDAVIERRKTVTRRKGWWEDKNGRRLLHVGDTLTLCRKVQGRKPGEPIERLCDVEVISIRREPLDRMVNLPLYGALEVMLEGFPGMRAHEFVQRYFVDAQGMRATGWVTRIEWRYLPSRCPECQQGKHGNCDGTTWDEATDGPTDCPCYVTEHQ